MTFVLFLSALAFAEPGFTPLFDGKSLQGWSGAPGLWSVENGSIVGSSDRVKLEKNTFLIFEKAFSDFILRFDVKLRNGNSGMQFRSQAMGDFVVHGYQADVSDAGDRSAWGNFYEEKGRGRNVMKTPSEGWEKAMAVVRRGDWNRYEIHAEGNHIRLTLNGHTTIDTFDEKARSGVIAIQLHMGDPMRVEMRNIRIKVLRP